MPEAMVVRLSSKGNPVPVGSIDVAGNDDERAVSILDERDGIETEKKDNMGLCSARFRADVRAMGLRGLALSTGDRILLGGAELQISGIGKDCFPQCGLHTMGSGCGLSTGVTWARVLKAGRVKLGDAIRKLDAGPVEKEKH